MICEFCGYDYEKTCPRCYSNSHKLISLKKKPKITRCSMCGKYLVSGKWVVNSLAATIESLLNKNLSIDKLPHQINIKTEFSESGETVFLTIRAEGTLEGFTWQQTLHRPIPIELKSCTLCSRKAGNYYEAIIQIRASGRLPVEEELKKASDVILAIASPRQNTILREKKVTGGVDYYVAPIRTARLMARHLKRIGATLSENTHHLSQNRLTGKAILRWAILARLPDYNVGDFVEMNQKLYQVISIGSSTKLRGFDGKPATLRDYTLIADSEDSKAAQIISIDKKKKIAQLMDDSFLVHDVALPDLAVHRGPIKFLIFKKKIHPIWFTNKKHSS